jgi:hypothetical protein
LPSFGRTRTQESTLRPASDSATLMNNLPI